VTINTLLYLKLDSYGHLPATFYATLLPGSHVLRDLNGFSLSFSVNPNDTVSYDPALEGILNGQGSNVLTVNGAPVLINTHLYAGLDSEGFAPGTFWMTLLPGIHHLTGFGGDTISFVVNPNGTISYDSSLEGILNGQGSKTLTINGAHVAIDARALGNTTVYLDDYRIQEQTASVNFVNLLPGKHDMLIYSGGHWNTYYFWVTNQGDLLLDSSTANVFSLQGPRTLLVKAAG
jgi:hypothetical protein